MLGVSALHYSTGNQEGFGSCFSSCTAHNYPLLMSEYFRCVLEVPRLSGSFRVVWEFGSLNPELSMSRDVSIEVMDKARVLEVTRIHWKRG